MKKDENSSFDFLQVIDKKFESDDIQRPAFYLSLWKRNVNLDGHTYNENKTLSSKQQNLEIVLEACPLQDRSLTELRMFLQSSMFSFQSCGKSLLQSLQ